MHAKTLHARLSEGWCNPEPASTVHCGFTHCTTYVHHARLVGQCLQDILKNLGSPLFFKASRVSTLRKSVAIAAVRCKTCRTRSAFLRQSATVLMVRCTGHFAVHRSRTELH